MLRTSLNGVSDPTKLSMSENERSALYKNALGILPDASVYKNKNRDYICSTKQRKQVDQANFCALFMIISLIFNLDTPDVTALGAIALFSLLCSIAVVYGYSLAATMLPRKMAKIAIAVVSIPLISLLSPAIFSLYENESLSAVSIIVGAVVYVGFVIYVYKKDANEIEELFKK